MNRFNWDSFRGYWDFDYKANIIEKPYSGLPTLTAPQREVSIVGVIEKHVLSCVEDVEILDTWFRTGSKLVTCPVFDRTPTIAGDIGMGLMFLPSGKLAICWDYKGTIKKFHFSSFYLGGTDIVAGNLNPAIDVNLPRRFMLNIRPKERGYQIQRRGALFHVEAIEFFVVPWAGYVKTV